MSEDKKRAFIAAVAAKDNDLARSILKEIDAAPSPPKRQGALSSISKGFNVGLASLAGAPVDVTNWALSGVDKLAGTKLSTDRPVGGSMFLKKAMRGWDKVPALSSRVIDRIGAGDAFLSLSSLCLAGGISSQVAGFVGSVAAAMDVQIVCNREPIDPVSLKKYITTLLK